MTTDEDCLDTADEIEDFNDWLDRPDWIEDAFAEVGDLEAIVHGGCASGAYMPAVTYYKARETMSIYGDDVLESIDDYLADVGVSLEGESWSGVCCMLLSIAVEQWAHSELQRYCDDFDYRSDYV